MTVVCACAVVLFIVTVISSLGAANAEDTDAQNAENAASFDTFIVSFFAVICAIVFSLFAVVLGYFSIKEDMLLRRYQRDGILIRAAVDADTIQHLRHLVVNSPSAPRCCCCPRSISNDATSDSACQTGDRECSFVIEYKTIDTNPHAFIKRVRKRVRAFESDFTELSPAWSPPKVPTIQFDLLPEETHVSFEGPVPSHGYPARHGLELDILQLAPYKKSGLPRNHVKRSCSWSYRLPTIAMVMMILLFAALCIYCAVGMTATAMMKTGDMTIDVLVWCSAIMSMLLTCEILLTRICGEKYMNLALQQEYLDGGEMLLDYGDSASLSSGDDSFLMP